MKSRVGLSSLKTPSAPSRKKTMSCCARHAVCCTPLDAQREHVDIKTQEIVDTNPSSHCDIKVHTTPKIQRWASPPNLLFANQVTRKLIETVCAIHVHILIISHLPRLLEILLESGLLSIYIVAA